MQISPKSLFEAPLGRPEITPGIYLGRGWHAGGDSAHWSRSKLAELVVDARAFPQTISLRIRLRLFNAAPDRPRLLNVHSPGHDPVSVTVTTPDPISVRIPSPRHVAEAKFSVIGLEIDALESPFLAGKSADERLLGLSVTEISLGVPELAFPIDIGTVVQEGVVLVEGWASPESGGRWSIGPSSVLHLPGELSPCGPATLKIAAEILPRSADHPPLEVDIRENGITLTSWRLRDSGDAWLCCPLSDWSDAVDRRLELTFRNLCSPAELGINSDQRLLGIRVKQLSLDD